MKREATNTMTTHDNDKCKATGRHATRHDDYDGNNDDARRLDDDDDNDDD